MTHQSFSIDEALRFGWNKLKLHSALLFQVLLTVFAVEVAHQIVSATMEGFAGFLAMAVLFFAGLVANIGLSRITLDLAKNQHAEYGDIVLPLDILIRYFLSSLLVTLIVCAGLVLLVVPGIYLALRFSMAQYPVLEGMGIMEGLKRSSRLTQGVKWKLLGFYVVIFLITALGAALFAAAAYILFPTSPEFSDTYFSLGLLIATPLTMLMSAHVYRELVHRVEGKA